MSYPNLSHTHLRRGGDRVRRIKYLVGRVDHHIHRRRRHDGLTVDDRRVLIDEVLVLPDRITTPLR